MPSAKTTQAGASTFKGALTSEALGEPVDQWIAAQRANSHTWWQIGQRLHDLTGLRISEQTLRNWEAA